MITVIPRKITATSVNGVAVTNDGNIDIRMPLSDVQEILESDAAINDTVGPASLVSITDGIVAPVDALTVGIEPVQDLHGYDHPWSGGSEKNLLETEDLAPCPPSSTDFSNTTPRTFTGGTYVTNLSHDNYYNDSITLDYSVDEYGIYVSSPKKEYGVSIPVFRLEIGATYALSAWKTNSGNLYASFYQQDGTFISNTVANPVNFTIPANTYCTLIHFQANTDGGYGSFSVVQLEKNSVATSYVPYSNICPITGWTGAKVTRTGKNLFDKSKVVFDSNVVRFIQYGVDVYAATLPNRDCVLDVGTYTLSISGDGTAIPTSLRVYDSSGNKIAISYNNKILTFTTTSAGPYRLEINFNSAVTWADYNIQLELGSTATDYEPYSGTTTLISWESEAGTVYGGTLDVANGVLTVDRASVDLGTIAYWSKDNNRPGVFYSSASATLRKTNGFCACSEYEWRNDSVPSPENLSSADNTISLYPSYGNGFIYIVDIAKAVLTTEQFKTAMSGIQLVYELATPITYTLTSQEISTFLGTNNIWADTGDTTVTYECDINLDDKKALTPSGLTLVWQTIKSLLNGKQNTLTFDSTPTNGSTNPVTSGGIYTALSGGQNTMVAFGTCASAAAEQNKVVTVSDSNWQLKVGSIVGVKFSNSNTYSATAAEPCTLNVNSSGAKAVYYDTGVYTGTNSSILGYNNRTNFYMYDGTYWVWLNMSNLDEGVDTISSAYCTTNASTAAKVASCSNFTLTANSYVHILIQYANTYDGAITLNINSTGAKPVFINGSASSASNDTLPAGTYIIYYDGTNYYFRTDGMLPGSIEKVNGHTVGKDVPSDAVFTDTTYESKSAASGGTAVSLVTTGEKYTWNNKTDKVSGATSGNFAGLDANGNLTDSGSKASDFLTSHQDISGKVDKNQGIANAGKALGIGNDGMVTPVPFSGTDFTGATASTAGTHGYVPAPAAGDQNKVLKGGGSWATIPETANEMPMSSSDNTTVKEAIDRLGQFTSISGSTKSSIQNNLVTFASDLTDGSIAAIKFSVGSNPDTPFETTTYVGTLYKAGTRLFVRVQGITKLEQDLNGYYREGYAWTWNSFNSEISDLNTTVSELGDVVTEFYLIIRPTFWTNSAPYLYTWRDSRVHADSYIEVTVENSSVDATADYIEYYKTQAGDGIVFKPNKRPTADLELAVTITNAQMHAASSIDADTVVTDAINGASSVDGALTVLNNNINTMVGTHSTDIVALKNDLGIVENGDTATHTIAQGQYVIWHSALYTADAAITSGTTLAASGNDKNLTAVENGGLNALNSNFTPSVFSLDYTDTFKAFIGSTRDLYYIKSGKVCIVSGYFYIEENQIPSNKNIQIANTGLSVFRETFFTLNDDEGAIVRSKITTGGSLISEGLFRHKGWHSFSATFLLN